MAILRYPLQPPVTNADTTPTEGTDYLMIRRKQIKYSDRNRYYQLNLPDNNVEMEFHPDVIYLAMPQNVATSYRPTYRQVNLGVLGSMAPSVLAELQNGADAATIAETVRQAAERALPEFTSNTFAEAVNGASQFLGLAGNIDSNSLVALSQGKVFNPYTEQLFSNMQFRTHSFAFKMFSRNEQEAKEVSDIIRYLKGGALPRYGTEKDSDNLNTRFFEVPDKFDLRFVRMDPNGRLDKEQGDLHFRMHTSVCTGVDVNYTPDGQYNAFRNSTNKLGEGGTIQVPAVQLNLQFTETQFVTQRDIKKGF